MTQTSTTLHQIKTWDLFNPSQEHKLLRNMVREFVESTVEPQALESDQKEYFNLSLFKKLGSLGLLGLTVPESFGGGGMGAIAAVLVHEEISASDPGLGLAYLAHAMLCANNLAINGNDDQKKHFLPPLCTGEHVGCMAMSEAHVGTDVLNMKTSAKKDGNQYIINGEKMWITNGTLDENKTPADCVLLYACTGDKNHRKLSTFVVEKSNPGYFVGQKIKGKLGMRSSNTAEIVFDNCIVPETNRIGKEGESLLHLMRNLEIERLTLAAQGIGIARRCLSIMNNYARERKAFGKPLSSFGQIQKYIAESYAQYMAAKTYVYDVARKLDLTSSGQRIDSDGAKLIATTTSKKIADHAIQVLGGYGYVSEYIVERLWRDAKLLEIGGGTLEAHQKNITRDLKNFVFE